MADPQTPADPAQSILGPLQIDNSIKAQAWEHFKAAKDPNDLAARIGQLNIPQSAKAQLWEAKKAGSTTNQNQNQTPPPVQPPPQQAGTGFLDWATTPFQWAQKMRQQRYAQTESQVQPKLNETPDEAYWRTLPAHLRRSAADVAAGMMSPIGVGSMATDLGELTGLSKIPAAASALRAVSGASGLTQVGEGAEALSQGDYAGAAQDIGFGAMGALGAARGSKAAKPPTVKAKTAPPPPPTPPGQAFAQRTSAATGEARAPIPAGGKFDVSRPSTTAEPQAIPGQEPSAMKGKKPQFAVSGGKATGTGFYPAELPKPPAEQPAVAPLPSELQAAVDAGDITQAGAAQLAAKMPQPTTQPTGPEAAAVAAAAPTFKVSMNVPPPPPSPDVEAPAGAPANLGPAPGHGPQLADWEIGALHALEQARAEGHITDDHLMHELTQSMQEGGPQSAYTQALIKMIGFPEGQPGGVKPAPNRPLTPTEWGVERRSFREPLGQKATIEANEAAQRAYNKDAIKRLKPTDAELAGTMYGSKLRLPDVGEGKTKPAPAGPVVEATPSTNTQAPTIQAATKKRGGAKVKAAATGEEAQAAEPQVAPGLTPPPEAAPTVTPLKRGAKAAQIADDFGPAVTSPVAASAASGFTPSPTGEAGRVVSETVMMKEAARQKVVEMNQKYPGVEAKLLADPEGKGWYVEANADAIAKAKGQAAPTAAPTVAAPPAGRQAPAFLKKGEVSTKPTVKARAPAPTFDIGKGPMVKPSEVPKHIKGQATQTLQSLFNSLRGKSSRSRDEEMTLRQVRTELARRPSAPPPSKYTETGELKPQLQTPTFSQTRVSAEDAANRGFVHFASGRKPEMRDVIAKLQAEHGDDAYRVEALGKHGYKISVDPSVVGTQAQTGQGITVEPSAPETPPLTSKVGEAAPKVAEAAASAVNPAPRKLDIKSIIDNPKGADTNDLIELVRQMGGKAPKQAGDRYVWNKVNAELQRRGAAGEIPQAAPPKGGGPVEPPPFVKGASDDAVKAQLDQLRSSLRNAPSTEQAGIRKRIQALVAKLSGEQGNIRISALVPPFSEEAIERLRKGAKPVVDKMTEEGAFSGDRTTGAPERDPFGAFPSPRPVDVTPTAEPGKAAKEAATAVTMRTPKASERRWSELLQQFGGKLAEQKGFASTTPVDAMRRYLLGKFEPAQLAKESVGEDAVADTLTRMHDPDVAATVFDNQKSKVLDQSFKEAETMFDRLPKDQQQLFNRAYGQAQTPEGRALQAEAVNDPAFKKLPPELKQVVKETSDYVYGVAKKAGFDIGYQPDYFYGAYKNRDDVSRFIDHWRATEKFTKEKVFPTRADAEAWGLELRDQNPITNIKRELQAVSRRASMQGILNNIEETKPSYAVKSSELTPEQRKTWSKLEDPIFSDYRFDPDYAKMVNSLLSINRVTTGSVSNALRQGARFGQQVKMFGSLFHLRNIMKGAVAAEPMGPANPKAWGSMLKAFHSGIDESDPAYLDYVNHGGGHHYSIESDATRNGLMKAFSHVYDEVKDTPIGKLMGKGNPLSPEFTKWMFDTYIPTIKYQGYLKEANRQVAAKGDALSNAEKIAIVRRLDEMHGEMNERLFGRSGTVTSGMRLLFMAPGYAEGNFRQTARILGGDTKALGFMAKSLAITAATAALGTRALTGHWPAQPKTLQDARDLFKVQTDQRRPNGDPLMFDMMTYEKDPMSILGNIVTGHPERIPKDLMNRFTGMISPTWRMMTHLATLFNGEVVTDQLGRPVYRTTEPWGNRLLKLIGHEGGEGGMLPIGASTLTMAQREGYSPAKSLALGVAGIQPTTSEAAKRARETRMEKFDARQQQIEDRRKARQEKRSMTPPPLATPSTNPFGASR